MEDANQKKKMLIKAIIATLVLFSIIFIILLFFMAQDAKKTKVIYGGVTYKTTTTEMETQNNERYQMKSIEYQDRGSIPITLTTPNGQTYYCIETISILAGYRYNKGAYSELNESTDKCHIDNGGEYVTFASDSDVIYKNIKTTKYEKELANKEENKNSQNSSESSLLYASEAPEEEIISLENPVLKFADGKLYASYDAITQGLNMSIILSDNNINIYTLEQLESSYSGFLNAKGYTLTSNFRNKRSLYKGLAVVGQNNKYGVVEIDSNNNCTEIITVKYDTVEYIQSINEFIISSEGNFGMIAPGNEQPTVELKYNNIELLDAKKELYIIENNKKYGVVNAKGKTIVPIEYDQIGIPNASLYKDQEIKSRYLIADKCIPVMSNGLYGLYDVDGNIIARPSYSSIGCENPSELINDTAARPTLTVPLPNGIECIVFSKEGNTGSKNYGMMTTDGDMILNAYYTAIYYMTSSGEATYYFNKVNNNELVTLEELINTRAQLRQLIEGKSTKRKTVDSSNSQEDQMENDAEDNEDNDNNDNDENNDNNDNNENNGNSENDEN